MNKSPLLVQLMVESCFHSFWEQLTLIPLYSSPHLLCRKRYDSICHTNYFWPFVAGWCSSQPVNFSFYFHFYCCFHCYELVDYRWKEQKAEPSINSTSTEWLVYGIMSCFDKQKTDAVSSFRKTREQSVQLIFSQK